MKFVKTCSDHLLAHLYEHLYFIYLDTELRNHGLFPIIDYSIDAFTEDGTITFDFESYGDIDVLQLVKAVDVAFSAEELFVEIALSQLECEHGRQVSATNVTALGNALRELNKQPWNGGQVFTNEQALVISGDSVKWMELRLTFSYPDLIDQVKPLYRLITGVTANVLVSDIADTFGAFVANEAFETDEAKNLIVLVRLIDDLHEHDIEKLFNETKHELSTNGGYDRLLEGLQDMQTMTSPPSNERAHIDTGIQMDDELWRQIATQANLKIVLEAMTYESSYTEIT